MNLETRIANIASHLDNISHSKLKLAFELLQTKIDVYWNDTPYLNFREFCDKNVALSQASIYVYVRTAQLSRRNYGDVEANHIVTTIGWERYKLGLTKL